MNRANPLLNDCRLETLESEVSRRHECQRRGVCEHCERHRDDRMCDKPVAHALARLKRETVGLFPAEIGEEAHTLLAEISAHGFGNCGLHKRIEELLREIVRRWD